MGTIKFSVVVTVLNEASTIGELVDSLQRQTLLPAEIIVVDAGSADGTREKVLSLKQQFPMLNVWLIKAKGSNRSKGRNLGIEAAKSEYIAVTDAGCVADRHWLERLASGFVGSTNVVAGFYAPVIKKPIQRLFAEYVATNPVDFDESSYLPSSRSLAFTKLIWQKVDGYPEALDTCEDLIFARDLKLKGTMVVEKGAVVRWHQASSFGEFFSQIAGYARGDVRARYIPHLKKILSVWLRWAIILAFPPLILFYFGYVVIKHRHWQAVGVQVICDLGIMWGTLTSGF